MPYLYLYQVFFTFETRTKYKQKNTFIKFIETLQ